MQDRVCVVTGGNAGIGKATALELARQGAHVVLACRSPAKVCTATYRLLRSRLVSILPSLPSSDPVLKVGFNGEY